MLCCLSPLLRVRRCVLCCIQRLGLTLMGGSQGVMNGIDPVIIATGNDWRAIEAGAHAYAARDGR